MPKYSLSLPLPFSLGEGCPDTVEIRRSDRKSVSLELGRDGIFFVRAPGRMEDGRILAFLREKEGWLRSHLEAQEKKRAQIPPEERGRLSMDDIRRLADAARRDLPARAARLAPLVGVHYGRITIRNQRTRWGSCSSAGNLNFNCLLMLAPPEARDYVVAHELCHRLEMNHSRRFWAEVERVCPDYRVQRRWFRENGPILMERAFGGAPGDADEDE